MALARSGPWIRRHGFWLVFAACLVAQLAPLCVTRYLPFHDLPAIEALAGTLALRQNPAAAIDRFYRIHIEANPYSLYFAWVYGATHLGLSTELATNLYLAAVFAALPLSVWMLVRSFGRPRWLSLLAFPVIYHKQVWFGFASSVAAIPALLAALALAHRMVRRPRLGVAIGLCAASLVATLAHPFAAALLLALLAPLFVLELPTREPLRWARCLGARAACLAPSLLVLGAWVRHFGDPGATGSTASWLRSLGHLFVLAEGTWRDAVLILWRWLGDGYRGIIDDAVTAVAVATLALYLTLGARAPEPEKVHRTWLLWAIGLLVAGFFLLPMHLLWPADWWGVRSRLVVPLFLVAAASVRPRLQGLGARWMAPACAASILYGGYLTVDFHTHWRQQVLPGLSETIAAMPPGRQVLTLSTLLRTEHHYTNDHPFLSQYYVVEKGGMMIPGMRGYEHSGWVIPSHIPPMPPYGDALAFRFARHAPFYQYFLVEDPIVGPPLSLFADAPPGAVTFVFGAGHFRLFRNNQAGP